MALSTVNIGGVPEHFNYPWHSAIQKGAFLEQGINLSWTDYPGGTGAMVQALNEGKLDMAVILTEGAVAAINQGCPAKIMHYTVKSPLYWGIHTGARSALTTIEDIPGKTFAISRFGSGSHLMATVQALLNNWPLDHMKWLEVKNLEGAQRALTENRAEVFLWERFMTKPLVDQGLFRLLGILPTPWPSFVLVAHERFLKAHQQEAMLISSTLLSTQKKIREKEDLVPILAHRYVLKEEDVTTWLEQTRWETEAVVPEQEIMEVSNCLVKAGIVQGAYPAGELMHACV